MSDTLDTTVTLFGATDATGRLYLVDRRDVLPADAHNIREFPVAANKVEWAILQVELETIRLRPVTIMVGNHTFISPLQPILSIEQTGDQVETA